LSGTGGAPGRWRSISIPIWPTRTRPTVDWGDGSPRCKTRRSIAGVGPGGPDSAGTHTYADDGNYTVTVNVADNTMAGAPRNRFDVLVKKRAASASDSPRNQMVNEGGVGGQLRSLSAPGRWRRRWGCLLIRVCSIRIRRPSIGAMAARNGGTTRLWLIEAMGGRRAGRYAHIRRQRRVHCYR